MIPDLVIDEHAPGAPNPTNIADDAPEIWRGGGDAVVAYSGTVNGKHWIDIPGVARFGFEAVGSIVNAHPHLAASPEAVRDAYRRAVLPMALQVRGTEVLHASAVVSNAGVVAFCGQSGTGKSTIAEGFSRRGYRVWADDAVAFDTSGGLALTISLPFQVRLRPAAAAFFPRNPSTQPVDERRAEAERRCPHSVPLATVCVLERVSELEGSVAIGRLPWVSAFHAVLAHAYCFSLQDSPRKRRMMEHYLQLVARVPCFAIRFRPGLEHLPVILDVIEQRVMSS